MISFKNILYHITACKNYEMRGKLLNCILVYYIYSLLVLRTKEKKLLRFLYVIGIEIYE